MTLSIGFDLTQCACAHNMSNRLTLYAAPAWWGLTQVSDILKIDKLQRKLQRIEYASHDQPTVESKVHKAEEKVFKKVTVEEDHGLRQYLPQNNTIKYNLRPRPHNFLHPPKDDSLFIARMLYRSKHYTSKINYYITSISTYNNITFILYY